MQKRNANSSRKSYPGPSALVPDEARSWFVYILCCRDGTLYTGITTDLSRRLRQHNLGKASRYTRTRLPVELRYQEPQPDRSHALRREMAIKALSHAQKLRLIQGLAVSNLGQASITRVPHVSARSNSGRTRRFAS